MVVCLCRLKKAMASSFERRLERLVQFPTITELEFLLKKSKLPGLAALKGDLARLRSLLRKRIVDSPHSLLHAKKVLLVGFLNSEELSTTGNKPDLVDRILGFLRVGAPKTFTDKLDEETAHAVRAHRQRKKKKAGKQSASPPVPPPGPEEEDEPFPVRLRLAWHALWRSVLHCSRAPADQSGTSTTHPHAVRLARYSYVLHRGATRVRGGCFANEQGGQLEPCWRHWD